MTVADEAAGGAAGAVTGRPPEFVRSLDRGLAVIRAFGAGEAELTLAQVARAAGLPRAAARRFLHTLVELGYVRTDGRVFALRPRVLELGFAYLSALSLPEIAAPHMEHLVEQVHESSSLSVLDEDDVVYVARVPVRRIVSLSISVGTRFPAAATAMGRVLLAGLEPAVLAQRLAAAPLPALTRRTVTDRRELARILERVRADGWCLVDSELDEGLRSVAVPVRDGAGSVVAALNVSAPASRGAVDALVADVLPALRAAAAAVEQELATTAGAGRVPGGADPGHGGAAQRRVSWGSPV